MVKRTGGEESGEELGEEEGGARKEMGNLLRMDREFSETVFKNWPIFVGKRKEKKKERMKKSKKKRKKKRKKATKLDLSSHPKSLSLATLTTRTPKGGKILNKISNIEGTAVMCWCPSTLRGKYPM